MAHLKNKPLVFGLNAPQGHGKPSPNRYVSISNDLNKSLTSLNLLPHIAAARCIEPKGIEVTRAPVSARGSPGPSSPPRTAPALRCGTSLLTEAGSTLNLLQNPTQLIRLLHFSDSSFQRPWRQMSAVHLQSCTTKLATKRLLLTCQLSRYSSPRQHPSG